MLEHFGVAKMRKHPYLIPLYVIIMGGLAGMTFQSIRTFIKHPDVMVNRKANPEPWEEYRTKQYKYWNSDKNFKHESKAPVLNKTE